MSFTKILNFNRAPGNHPRSAGLRVCWNRVPTPLWKAMAARSQALTRQHFGRTMRLFAPLYLSNECINNCKYCGFSRDNPILRVTLPVAEVVTEARHLAAEGFRNVLLVAGEHPKFVSNGYLEACVRAVCSGRRGTGSLARSRSDGNGGIPAPRGSGGGRVWSFTRKLISARFMRNSILLGQSVTLTGGWIARSALTTPGSGGWGSGRFSAWRIGGRKRWRWEPMSITCCAGAGKHMSPSACRGCARQRVGSRRVFRSRTVTWCSCCVRCG